MAASTRCSICHTLVRPGENSYDCPTCHQGYHQECWDEIGGCATYGCEQAAEAEKEAPPARTGGWGDHKRCPSCAVELPSSLLLCRTCGARFPWADPIAPEEWHQIETERAQLKSAKLTILWMFIISLFGAPAPITGTIAGVYAHRKRDLLAGAEGTWLAIGYGSLAIGATYALIILLLAVGL